MDSIHQRLKELRTALNLSQRQFSKQIYISQSLYAEVEIGNREAGERIIQLISSRFNVSKDWIKKGEGEIFSAPPPDVHLERLIEIYHELDEMMKQCLLEQSDILLRIHREKNTAKDAE